VSQDLRIRCSSLGRLMTEPRSKSEGVLSVGAKTYVRELAAQSIFGVDFEISSKEMEKGIEVEPESIALLSRVRGLTLVKNAERRTNAWITGEPDIVLPKKGHDVKSSWSVKTFPLTVEDIDAKAVPLYTWQMRGYMMLWDADEWSIDWVLVDTPDHLIRHEPQSLHFVSHIPEHLRVTSLHVRRDRAAEALIAEKVEAARAYYAEVIAEFDRTHRPRATAADPMEPPWDLPTAAPVAPPAVRKAQPLPATIF
jgi:hypothetical protein